MTGNGKPGRASRDEIRQAILVAFSRHEVLDMNDLLMAVSESRPVIEGVPFANAGEMIAVVEELVQEGQLEELPQGAGPRRFRRT